MRQGATNLFVEKPLALSEHSQPELTNIIIQMYDLWPHLRHNVLLGRGAPLTRARPLCGLRARDGGHDSRHEGLCRPSPGLLAAGLRPGVWDHVPSPGLLSLVSPWANFTILSSAHHIFSRVSPAAATSACLGALPRLAFLSSSLCFFVLLSWVTTIGVSSASGNHKFLRISDDNMFYDCHCWCWLLENHEAQSWNVNWDHEEKH